LAKALKGLEPATTDYSTAPYVEAFNWSTVLETLKTSIEAERGFHWEEQFFYIVVFRSQIRPAIDSGYLGARDQASHAEATESGGLLKYWFGYPDKNKRNLATCLLLPILKHHIDQLTTCKAFGEKRVMQVLGA
jgi:hypothetical protein